MTLIDLAELRKWRANRIQGGQCSFDDMTALNAFMDTVDGYDFVPCVACRYCSERGGHANCGGYLYCKRQKTIVDETSGCTWGEER